MLFFPLHCFLSTETISAPCDFLPSFLIQRSSPCATSVILHPPRARASVRSRSWCTLLILVHDSVHGSYQTSSTGSHWDERSHSSLLWVLQWNLFEFLFYFIFLGLKGVSSRNVGFGCGCNSCFCGVFFVFFKSWTRCLIFFSPPQVLKKTFEQICFINILSPAVFRYGHIQMGVFFCLRHRFTVKMYKCNYNRCKSFKRAFKKTWIWLNAAVGNDSSCPECHWSCLRSQISDLLWPLEEKEYDNTVNG